MPGWSFFPYLSYFITVLIKLLTWHSLNVITSHFNLVQWSWRRPCIHHHGMTMYVRAPSRFCNISTTKIQTSVAIFLLMTMSSFYPYIVPYLIRWLCPHMTCVFFSLLHEFTYWILSFLLLSPHCIQFFLLICPFWIIFFFVWANLNHIYNMLLDWGCELNRMIRFRFHMFEDNGTGRIWIRFQLIL